MKNFLLDVVLPFLGAVGLAALMLGCGSLLTAPTSTPMHDHCWHLDTTPRIAIDAFYRLPGSPVHWQENKTCCRCGAREHKEGTFDPCADHGPHHPDCAWRNATSTQWRSESWSATGTILAVTSTSWRMP